MLKLFIVIILISVILLSEFSLSNALNSLFDEDLMLIDVPFNEYKSLYNSGKLQRCLKTIPEIDGGDRERIRLIVNKEQYKFLLEQNIDIKIIYRTLDEWEDSLKLTSINGYHNYSELTVHLNQLASNFPDITTITSIGKSVQGRNIWAIKITDNPNIEEFEPEVRIMGAHHGDELISAEVPLLLADYLLQNYEENAYIYSLVNSTEIWIIPMVNPDGAELYFANQTPQARYNLHNVDLNRNYGYMWKAGATTGTSPFSEPETKSIRDMSLVNPFVLSLSFHSGATCINYVWNYSYEPTLDEPLIIHLSKGYANRNTTKGFWITNGADWYITNGDANDWSYGERGDIDWTIELSAIKTPPDTSIQRIFMENLNSILYVIDKSRTGIQGIVQDSLYNVPISATVSVYKNGIKAGTDIYTDSKIGDYHRVLLPGNYDLRFSSWGYYTKEISNVQPDTNSANIQNVKLIPKAGITGTVKDSMNNPIPFVSVIVHNDTLTTDLNGKYYKALEPGIYEIRFEKYGYQTVSYYSLSIDSILTLDTILLQGIPVAVKNPKIPLSDSYTKLELFQNFPNPFNYKTVIRYEIQNKDHIKYPVSLNIYNIKGQLVKSLVNELQSDGNYSIEWDGKNYEGESLPTGIYIYKLNIGNDSYSKYLVIVK